MSETQTVKPDVTQSLFSARVAASQCVYESLMSQRDIQDIVREHLATEALPVDHDEGQIETVHPNKKLFSAIAQGVFERFGELNEVVDAHYSSEGKKMENLLRAVLLCAGWELLAKPDLDSPIIINDYLDVTHGFFDKGEVRLVNGMLDRMAKNLR